MVSTISDEIYASGPRLSSGPVQSIVTLQPHCCIFCNAASIVTLRHLYSTDTITIYQCGLAKFSRYYVSVAFPSHYAVSSIDGSSQNRHYGPPTPILVLGIIVQECGPARFSRYYITAASPSQYAVSSINGSSQSRLYDPPALSSSQELLYKSVDSPDLISTTSPLRLHYIMPSQASTVLHIVDTVTLSPELLSSTEVPRLLAIKTLWLGFSTSISTFLRFFECGL
ncbi:hypothetical protein Bca101_006570 [Brassica carinata]